MKQLLFILFSLVLMLNAQSDFEYWTSIKFEKQVSKKSSLSYAQGLRTHLNASSLKGILHRFGWKYKVNKKISIVPEYRFVYRPSDSYNRYSLDVDFRHNIGDFRFKLRNRVQYETDYASDLKIEWRDRFLISYKTKAAKFIPFVGVEAFSELTGAFNGVNRWRYYGGVQTKLSKRTTFKLALIYQEERVTDSDKGTILNGGLNIKLK